MFPQHLAAAVAPFCQHFPPGRQEGFTVFDKPQRGQLFQHRRAQIQRVARLREGGDSAGRGADPAETQPTPEAFACGTQRHHRGLRVKGGQRRRRGNIEPEIDHGFIHHQRGAGLRGDVGYGLARHGIHATSGRIMKIRHQIGQTRGGLGKRCGKTVGIPARFRQRDAHGPA